MTKVENPLADLANKLTTVRVVWGIVGTIAATLGLTIPFVSPDLFTVTAFDQIVEFIVGAVGAAFALYQAYGRKLVVGDGVSAKSVNPNVAIGPFGNVVV